MEESRRASFIKNATDILQYFDSRTTKLVNGSGDPFNCNNLSHEEKAIIILSRMTEFLSFQNENDKLVQDSTNNKSKNNFYQKSIKNNNQVSIPNSNKAISIDDLYDQISSVVRHKRRQNKKLKSATQIQLERLYSLRFASNNSVSTSQKDEASRYALAFQQKAQTFLEQSIQAKAEINMLEIENKNLEQNLIIFQRVHQRLLNNATINPTVNQTKNDNKTEFPMSLREQQARINKTRSSIENLQKENQFLEMKIESYEKRIKSMMISTNSHLSLADRALMNIPTKISTDSIKSNDLNRHLDNSRNRNIYNMKYKNEDKSKDEFNHQKGKKVHKKRKNRNKNDENDYNTNYENESDHPSTDIDFSYNSNDLKKSTPRRKTHNENNEDDQYFTNDTQDQNDNDSHASNEHKKRRRKHRTHKTSHKNDDANEQLDEYIKDQSNDVNGEFDNYDENYSSIDSKAHTHDHKKYEKNDDQSYTNQNQPLSSTYNPNYKKRIRKRKTHSNKPSDSNENDSIDSYDHTNAGMNQNGQNYEDNFYNQSDQQNQNEANQAYQRHRKRVHKHRSHKNDEEVQDCGSENSYTSDKHRKRSRSHSTHQNNDNATNNGFPNDYSYASHDHKKRIKSHSIHQDNDNENTTNNTFTSDYSFASNDHHNQSRSNPIQPNNDNPSNNNFTSDYNFASNDPKTGIQSHATQQNNEDNDNSKNNVFTSDYSFTSHEFNPQNNSQQPYQNNSWNDDDASSASSITHIDSTTTTDSHQHPITTIGSTNFTDKPPKTTDTNTDLSPPITNGQIKVNSPSQPETPENDDKTAENDLKGENLQNSDSRASSSPLGIDSPFSCGGFGTSHSKSRSQNQPPPQKQQPRRVVMPGRTYRKPQMGHRMSAAMLNLNMNRGSCSGEVNGEVKSKEVGEVKPTKTAKEAAMEVVEIIQQFKAMLHGDAESQNENDSESEKDEN